MAIWIIEDKCDGCQKCIRACPYEGIEMVDGIASVTERCTSCGACIEACNKKHAIESDIKPREVPDFSDRRGIWVFAEQTNGKLAKVSLELLGKAQDLAMDIGHKVSALLLGKDVSHLIQT
ncbi:MAG: 4Fe-4S binding protein, partial [Deltaproteobacteria bacterium]|nr:4Fe-4S binding protein [Deltaproteobacteria bacterium]